MITDFCLIRLTLGNMPTVIVHGNESLFTKVSQVHLLLLFSALCTMTIIAHGICECNTDVGGIPGDSDLGN